MSEVAIFTFKLLRQIFLQSAKWKLLLSEVLKKNLSPNVYGLIKT